MNNGVAVEDQYDDHDDDNDLRRPTDKERAAIRAHQKKLAVCVDELVQDSLVMGWFREMVGQWNTEKPEDPVEVFPCRAVSIAHKCAVLAAIHDRVCEGAPKIDPWDRLTQVVRSEFAEELPRHKTWGAAIPYAVLSSRLTPMRICPDNGDGSGDLYCYVYHQKTIDGWLADVERALDERFRPPCGVGRSAAAPDAPNVPDPPAPKLPRQAARAGQQYEETCRYLEEQEANPKPTDKDVYDKLSKIYGDRKAGNDLPNFDTWARDLRRWRKATGNQKNRPRHDRPARSVVPASQL